MASAFSQQLSDLLCLHLRGLPVFQQDRLLQVRTFCRFYSSMHVKHAISVLDSRFESRDTGCPCPQLG